VLVCYDHFHLKIFDGEENLMFATEPRLFSIVTITILTLVWSNQPINLTTLIGLNLVEQVYVHVEVVSLLLILSDIFVELVYVLLVKIIIPLDIFKQQLLETFFQLEVREMEIDEMIA
jgi:hypothetical protein